MGKNVNDYALVVGIDHYPNFQPLKGAKKDALSFINWLEKESGGNLPKTNIQKVLSKTRPIKPIHDDFDLSLQTIIKSLNGRMARRLYIYFSGHGLARTRRETDLCLASWSRERVGLVLDSDDYLELLIESGWFEEIFMFFDCCRIRKIHNRALRSTIDIARPSEQAAMTKYVLVNATEYMTSAYEMEEELSGDVRGFFTVALLEGLEGKAAKPGGGVPLNRLQTYLAGRVEELAKASGKSQKPEFTTGNINGSAGSIIFGSAKLKKSDSVAVTISFSNELRGEVTVEDSNLDIITQHDVSQGDLKLQLTRGQYAVVQASNNVEMLLRIKGDEGEKHVTV